MGKYEPLSARLSGESENSWTATFAELEAVLGFSLPTSARTYREWWGNQQGAGHSQARAWQDAGWHVWKVSLPDETVTFRRLPGEGKAVERSPVSDNALFEQASAYLGVTDRQEIIREALKALCAREAGRRLAELGGTMPDLKAPPRRRFG